MGTGNLRDEALEEINIIVLDLKSKFGVYKKWVEVDPASILQMSDIEPFWNLEDAETKLNEVEALIVLALE